MQAEATQPGWQTLKVQAPQPPVPGVVGALLQLTACPTQVPHWQAALQVCVPQFPHGTVCPGAHGPAPAHPPH